ncbi:MAG: hypothetical protein DMG55_14620 [Acidobacteria bacterium]|nr:MAG: hypothetical protein DMG55_14620 [Acidobacteriota bacterium]
MEWTNCGESAPSLRVCFILLYETQLRAFCQHIFTYFLFAGTQKLGEGKVFAEVVRQGFAARREKKLRQQKRADTRTRLRSE